jgi:predicted small metal-binding protein
MKMAKTVVCDCGFVVQADNDDELVAGVEKHVADKHPGMSMRREEILAMAKDE